MTAALLSGIHAHRAYFRERLPLLHFLVMKDCLNKSAKFGSGLAKLFLRVTGDPMSMYVFWPNVAFTIVLLLVFHAAAGEILKLFWRKGIRKQISEEREKFEIP